MSELDDVVEVWKAEDGWRWRRQARNGDIVSEGGEGYNNKGDGIDAAKRVNPGIEIDIIEKETP